MTRKLGIAAFVVALAASVGAVAGGDSGAASEAATPNTTAQAANGKPLRYEEHDLYIEFNDTDRDAGLQLFLDAEDWKRTKIVPPNGLKPLVNVKAKGRLRAFGLTELFFEASEPSFNEVPFRKFKQRFPEGKYGFRGRTVEGRKLRAFDRFTHVVPDGPEITSPVDGGEVDPDGFTAAWEPVTSPPRAKIVRYIVVVVQKGRDLEMELPGDVTSVAIPGEFLAPETNTELEVLAKEKSGNQTITAIELRTTD